MKGRGSARGWVNRFNHEHLWHKGTESGRAHHPSVKWGGVTNYKGKKLAGRTYLDQVL
jgi:hypothetical protein